MKQSKIEANNPERPPALADATGSEVREIADRLKNEIVPGLIEKMKGQCTHGNGFCPVHQHGCQVHYWLMGDGRCSCVDCPPNSKLTDR